MSREDVLSFARQNPACTIATVDGDQPHVRGFLSIFFDGDDRIYFTTSTQKSVGRQIEANRKVELCYLAPDFLKMLRITTQIDIVDDYGKKKEIVERQDYLKGVDPNDPTFKLLRVSSGKARFWSLADNMKEDSLEVIEI
jgi:uncharacterized pyridoxamine 5'-phosphate oxidase family protein